MSDQRIRWACRRGMLELDLFLLPFFEHHFEKLEPQEKAFFVELLEAQDTDIQSWLLEQEEPPAQLKKLVHTIITFRKNDF